DLRRFAILFRRMTQIDDYLDVFEREGIRVTLPPTRLFLDRRAPVDLVAVLRAIAYPFDRGAMISAARTPYFALTDEEIAQPSDAWSSFTRTIDGYVAASNQLTTSEMIDLLVHTSCIEAIYDAAADGQRLRRHLDHVRAIAFDYQQNIGGSLRQFVDEIARRRDEPEESEPLLIDDDENAVRILTVHTAKGLEFDTVIIPDMTFGVGENEKSQIFAVDEPKSFVMRKPDSLSARYRSSSGEPLRDIAKQRE